MFGVSREKTEIHEITLQVVVRPHHQDPEEWDWEDLLGEFAYVVESKKLAGFTDPSAQEWFDQTEEEAAGDAEGPTYHGITKVECLTCGHQTTIRTEMEIWNDLGVTCLGNEHKGGRVRWTLSDGTTRITTEDADGNLLDTEEEV